MEIEGSDLGAPWCWCLKTASNLVSVAFVLEELSSWLLWSLNSVLSVRLCFMMIVLRTYIFSPLTRSQCCALKQSQEEIAQAKSLGFDLYNNMGYIEVDFLGVILKGNCLLKRCSFYIMGIYIEKPKTLWDARSYVSGIEKLCLRFFSRHIESHQISGSDKDLQVSVWRLSRSK